MESAELARHFEEVFGVVPRIFSAPGRVNLIGEHTDYNDGFVMPSAIGSHTRVAIARRWDDKLVLHSLNFPERFEFEANHLPRQRLGAWCDYVLGVAVELREIGHPPRGASLIVDGNVPIGAGLSSSAAIEVASALAFLSLIEARIDLPEVAKLCQRAENSFVGAHVGIMDQFVSCLGRAGHALLLDCRSLEYKLIPVPDQVRMVICNTMVKHELKEGEYNLRRRQCEQGVKILSEWVPGVRALRDLSADQVEQHRDALPDVIYRRCMHVVQENQRVLDGAQCLENGELRKFGELMGESHRSLRDLYEVSCSELDVMVELASPLAGCYGARMTGGGFGGCTINLVNAGDALAFAAEISERYQEKTGIKPDVYISAAVDGAAASAGLHPVTV